MSRQSLLLAASFLTAICVTGAGAQQDPFLHISDVRPGMTGIGRTVFNGTALEDFKVEILGTLKNVIGPGRSLIVAKLDGGPLATAGVIAGMSGSPVYVDGKLVGAVSYSLGSFPKEPYAGITPIDEMISAVDDNGPRPRNPGLALPLNATAADAYALLRRIVDGSTQPIGSSASVATDPTLARLVPNLRPIGAGFMLSGFDADTSAAVGSAVGTLAGSTNAPPQNRVGASSQTLRPGDAFGVALVRGDFEMGATGTVTYVNGTRMYGFGHPFLNLGPTSIVMTRADVVAVLPSLE